MAGGKLTRLVGAILAVTVVIVDLIKRDGDRAIQASERLGLIVEVMVWGGEQETQPRAGGGPLNLMAPLLPPIG